MITTIGGCLQVLVARASRLSEPFVLGSAKCQDTRLNDALPAVLQPLLVELVESPEALRG